MRGDRARSGDDTTSISPKRLCGSALTPRPLAKMAATIPFESLGEFITALAKMELLHSGIARIDLEQQSLLDATARERPKLEPGDDFFLSPSSIQCVSKRHKRFELLFTGYEIRDPHFAAKHDMGFLGTDITLGFDACRGTQAVNLCEDVKDDLDINDAHYDQCVRKACEVLAEPYPENWRVDYEAYVKNHWSNMPYR